MNKFDFEKFVKDAKAVQLSPSEKEQGLNYLKRVLEAEPARDVSKVSLDGHKQWSNPFNYLNFNLKPMPIILVLAILVGGGTSLAAEQALPGDPLYPIKISVNENMRSWLAFSDEARASLEAKLAEKRLEEAEKLAARNELDEAVRIKIEQNFQAHADRVEQRIAQFESRNHPKAAEVHAHFQTSLEAHAKIIDNIGTSLDGQVEVQLNKLAVHVKKEHNDADENRLKQERKVQSETGANVEGAAAGKFKAATNKIEEATKFLENNKDKFDAESVAKAEARLQLATDTLTNGQTQLEAKHYGEAFLLFQRAHNIAQEVKLLLNAKEKFEPTITLLPSPSVQIQIQESREIETDNDEVRTRGQIRIKLDF